MTWHTLLEKIRPAFDEMLAYVFALAGLVAGPALAVTEGKWRPTFPSLRECVVAGIIATVIVLWSEMKGTAEGKKKAEVRVRRYFFSFVIGLLGVPGARLMLTAFQELIL